MGRDGGQILGAHDLAGGVAFEAEQGVVAIHADAIVGHANEAASSGLHLDADARGLGVEGVFDQFLDHTGRPLDHFAGRDLVRDVFGRRRMRFTGGR
jgi:hypothetical protein